MRDWLRPLLRTADPASPPSRSSSELTLIDSHQSSSRAGDKLENEDGRRTALHRALLIVIHTLASTGVALTARKLGSGNAQLRYRAQLLAPVAFALLALGAALPRVLPHLCARLGIEVQAGSRSSGHLLRRAIPIGTLAAASVLGALELPRLVSVEAEQGIATYASVVVLLAAPLVSGGLPKERVQLSALVIALFFAYALLSVSISPRGALLATLSAVWTGLYATTVSRWLASVSVSQCLMLYTPIAGVLSIMAPLTLGQQESTTGWSTPHSWVRYEPPSSTLMTPYYFGFIASLAIEHVTAVLALHSFSSPISFTLLALPRALIVFGATYAAAGATHLGLAFALGAGTWAWADPESGPVHLWRQWRDVESEDDLSTAIEKARSIGGGDESSTTYSVSFSRHYLRIFGALLPFAYFLARAARGEAYHVGAGSVLLSTDVVSDTSHSSLDLVFSYFDEPLEAFRNHISYMRAATPIASRSPRVIVYVKSTPASLADFAHDVGADEVYNLPNLGREGATYLQHILRNYGRAPDAKTGAGGLADQTAFCQDHLSWHGVAEKRLETLTPETGYLHFAPYVASDCGLDLENHISFERMRDIYTLFREELCPPDHQLSAWSAQFFVSKRRILANSLSKYKKMLSIMEAPTGHWLHNDTRVGFAWGEEGFGPSNPAIGHALERSWPVIFDCNDLAIAERCGQEGDVEPCQCFDR